MKTTLKYNTIETLQQQTAWKMFIDTLVEGCKKLFDNNLVTRVDDNAKGKNNQTVHITELKPFDKYIAESYDNLSELDKIKYKDIYERYKDCQTDYEDMQTQNAMLGYLNDVFPLNLRENISLRGLLRTLSLYKCKIKDIKLKGDLLPHTYKVEGSRKDSVMYGFEPKNKTYDYESAGKRPVANLNDTDEYDSGDVEADCFDKLIDKNYEEENTTFKYIYNIYGYNQKHPIISISEIKEVKGYYEFSRNGNTNHPVYLYISESDILISENDFAICTNIVYKSNDNRDSGIILYDYDDDLSLKDLLSDSYTRGELVYKWVSISDTTSYLYESSFIMNDNDKIDLVKENNRIKYNSQEYALFEYKNISFALTSNSPIEKINLSRENSIGSIGTKDVIDTHYDYDIQKKYFVYKDNVYERFWIIKDQILSYFNNSILYLKNQLFANECTLKAQPLFVYQDGECVQVSTCANFIKGEGGIGKLSYEIEKYDINNIISSFTASDNVFENNEDSTSNIIKGITYGDWFFKWEEYGVNESNNSKTFFYKDVYTPLNFDKAIPSYNSHSLDYFFDGFGKETYINGNNEYYNDNSYKKINGRVYENTFKEEYIETMYFNHFVKVYPIVSNESDSIVSTTKLYCENLELVMFGNIVPYIVSYDRIGETPEIDSDEVLNDIDCSIFSKIIAYNKHTHLISVNNPVFFENSHTPKYVVVAYQNASPFNKIQSLDIISPNFYDYDNDNENRGEGDYENIDDTKTFFLKKVVKDLLSDYENDNCELNLYAECEYKGNSLL